MSRKNLLPENLAQTTDNFLELHRNAEDVGDDCGLHGVVPLSLLEKSLRPGARDSRVEDLDVLQPSLLVFLQHGEDLDELRGRQPGELEFHDL